MHVNLFQRFPLQIYVVVKRNPDPTSTVPSSGASTEFNTGVVSVSISSEEPARSIVTAISSVVMLSSAMGTTSNPTAISSSAVESPTVTIAVSDFEASTSSVGESSSFIVVQSIFTEMTTDVKISSPVVSVIMLQSITPGSSSPSAQGTSTMAITLVVSLSSGAIVPTHTPLGTVPEEDTASSPSTTRTSVSAIPPSPGVAAGIGVAVAPIVGGVIAVVVVVAIAVVLLFVVVAVRRQRKRTGKKHFYVGKHSLVCMNPISLTDSIIFTTECVVHAINPSDSEYSVLWTFACWSVVHRCMYTLLECIHNLHRWS